MIAVLVIASCFAIVINARMSAIENNSLYCCTFDSNSTASCSVGGCQRGNVTAFHVVDDCAHCTNNNSSVTNMSNNTTSTTCTYCNGAAPSSCANTTSDDAFGCAPPNASFPILYSFVATSTQMPRPLCCWFAENATAFVVVDAVDSCRSTRQRSPLVAFAEHLFDFECPPRPPCEDDCSGHGQCAVSQCVCDKSFFGDTCNVRCDSRTCVLGHCYAMRGSEQLCHCHPNVVGERCDRCAPGFSGVDCMSAISSGGSGTTSTIDGSSSRSSSTDVPTVTTSAASLSASLPGRNDSTPSSTGTTTEMVRDRSRTAETLDTFSIIALSIGGVVMMTLLICTFRRCIVWMREQRSGGSGDSFMLLQAGANGRTTTASTSATMIRQLTKCLPGSRLKWRIAFGFLTRVTELIVFALFFHDEIVSHQGSIDHLWLFLSSYVGLGLMFMAYFVKFVLEVALPLRPTPKFAFALCRSSSGSPCASPQQQSRRFSC
jgi:hypothetical protein